MTLPHRRRLTPVATALLAVCLVVAPGCNTSPAAPSTPAQVVAFGDSLTFGIGTTGDNDFVSVLSRRLAVTIVNAGRPGDTTAAALARLETQVLARSPGVVIVLLGGNDLLQGVPVDQRVGNITTIVQRIRGSGAAVLLVGLGDGPLDPFAGVLPSLASNTSSTYVPGILEGIFGVAALMTDSVHPNNAGHAVMADRLEGPLRAAVAAVPK